MVSQLPFECSNVPFRIWGRIPHGRKVPGQEGEQMLLGQAGMAGDSPAYLDQLNVEQGVEMPFPPPTGVICLE